MISYTSSGVVEFWSYLGINSAESFERSENHALSSVSRTLVIAHILSGAVQAYPDRRSLDVIGVPRQVWNASSPNGKACGDDCCGWKGGHLGHERESLSRWNRLPRPFIELVEDHAF